MGARPENSPEYQVIQRNRTEYLTEIVDSHLKDIADRLRNCKDSLLTESQHREIIRLPEDGADKLIGHILLAIKASSNPCEPFNIFIDTLDRCGNAPTRNYIKDKIKPQRKMLYRDLLKPRPPAVSGMQLVLHITLTLS